MDGVEMSSSRQLRAAVKRGEVVRDSVFDREVEYAPRGNNDPYPWVSPWSEEEGTGLTFRWNAPELYLDTGEPEEPEEPGPAQTTQ